MVDMCLKVGLEQLEEINMVNVTIKYTVKE